MAQPSNALGVAADAPSIYDRASAGGSQMTHLAAMEDPAGSLVPVGPAYMCSRLQSKAPPQTLASHQSGVGKMPSFPVFGELPGGVSASLQVLSATGMIVAMDPLGRYSLMDYLSFAANEKPIPLRA